MNVLQNNVQAGAVKLQGLIDFYLTGPNLENKYHAFERRIFKRLFYHGP
jgi:hypothetical protein